MHQRLSKLLRNWFPWLMLVVLATSLTGWFLTRVTLPREIRIGTAVQGGLYFEEGQQVAEAIRHRTQRAVTVVQTSGSQENCERLRAGSLDVAIVQSGSVSLRDLAIVTPLHRDVVHVLVRKELLADTESPIRSVSDLAGQSVIIGLPGSGMQQSAHDILEHYGVLQSVELCEIHFTELLGESNPSDTNDENGDRNDLQNNDASNNKNYAAAIVTTGVENNDMRRVLQSGKFDLLPLDASALAKRYRHFENYSIPTNLWPPLPQQDVPTVAASAMLVVREDASSQLVQLLLDSVFEDNLPEYFPAMFLKRQAKDFSPARLHPVTRRYHDPFGQYGVLHTILESLVACKELLLALGAAIYLIWDRWRRMEERENLVAIKIQKDHLDQFLEKTLTIERSQMDITDPKRLQQYLDEVTNIKLQALSKMTHEDLRSDRAFSIFLMQCANLISKIQLKILHNAKNLSEETKLSNLQQQEEEST